MHAPETDAVGEGVGVGVGLAEGVGVDVGAVVLLVAVGDGLGVADVLAVTWGLDPAPPEVLSSARVAPAPRTSTATSTVTRSLHRIGLGKHTSVARAGAALAVDLAARSRLDGESHAGRRRPERLSCILALDSMQHAQSRRGPSPAKPAASAAPRIGILVVAYNAASTLAKVLDRVPLSFRPRVTQVFVFDDASQDSTYLVGLGYKQITSDLPLTLIRHRRSLGYGGTQKVGYRLAIEHGLDIVVLLHGNGEYAPESLEEMTAPLERAECDAVLGSRMLVRGAARRGGMPAYKYVGNKILTRFENRVLGTGLSELHSGYRAYSVRALATIPFERNSDGFDFDTQLLIQLIHAGKRIVEVPIPTYYGSEIRHVNGLKYAAEVSGDALRYWAAKRGLLADSLVEIGPEYELKGGEGGSHDVVQRWLKRMPPARVLDLGCSSGLLAERIRGFGHRVTGVDLQELPGVRQRVDHFVRADLDQGLPPGLDADGGYDVVIAADVLEHLRNAQRLLEQVREVLAPRGTLIASVPNLGHWYSRGRIALGLFDYDQRGILDSTHVRFFTRRSFRRCMRQAGFTVLREEATGLPVEVLTSGRGPLARLARVLDRVAVGLRPTLFAYQFVCQCQRSTQVAESAGGS